MSDQAELSYHGLRSVEGFELPEPISFAERHVLWTAVRLGGEDIPIKWLTRLSYEKVVNIRRYAPEAMELTQLAVTNVVQDGLLEESELLPRYFNLTTFGWQITAESARRIINDPDHNGMTRKTAKTILKLTSGPLFRELGGQTHDPVIG